MHIPSYIKTHKEGGLKEKANSAYKIIQKCNLCPRECGINRTKGEKGFCGIFDLPVISSAFPHFGEEPPISGFSGSGTIFFSGCNLGCIFCQNYDISHLRDSHEGEGYEISIPELADYILSLQDKGCHNINFVTPTHQVPFILDALCIAVKKGLKIPLVYNCGGYESVKTIKLLEGVFDIYMPDFKFWDEVYAEKFCRVKDYRKNAKESIKEMHRQTGDLKLDDKSIAYKGVLVRHLVMPEDIAGTYEVCKFLNNEISPGTYINIMDQYRPCYKAYDYPEISRSINGKEYSAAVKNCLKSGLHRLSK
ncbi:MAG: radical SAM protein [Armatimonadota bacterium]